MSFDNNPTKHERNSSVELFRLLAAFMVVLVHCNGWFVGMPEKLPDFSVAHVGQGIIESMTCVCVNCFLVITGWYGLKLRFKHLFKIWFTLFFLNISLELFRLSSGGAFSLHLLLSDILAVGSESYFVNCYLMLILLAPLLNAFIDKYGKSATPWVMMFWLVEFVWGFIYRNKCLGFAGGYGLTHFVFMYLLGRVVYLHRDYLLRKLSVAKCISIYLGG